jgi:hypothetical protein
LGGNFSLVEFSRVSTVENFGQSSHDGESSADEKLERGRDSIPKLDDGIGTLKAFLKAKEVAHKKVLESLQRQLTKFSSDLDSVNENKKRLEHEKVVAQNSLNGTVKEIEAGKENNVQAIHSLEESRAALGSQYIEWQEKVNEQQHLRDTLEAPASAGVSAEVVESESLKLSITQTDSMILEEYDRVVEWFRISRFEGEGRDAQEKILGIAQETTKFALQTEAVEKSIKDLKSYSSKVQNQQKMCLEKMEKLKNADKTSQLAVSST